MNIPTYPAPQTPGFAACSLDRKAEWRTDKSLREQDLDNAGLILVNRYRMPINGVGVAILPAQDFAKQLDQAIWLGVWHGNPLYALEVDDELAKSRPELRFSDLRGAAMRLPADDAAVMAYARAMVFWHKRHRFCGRCGNATQATHAGHVLRCEPCNLEHYPRSDPSMLVQVSDPDDRCLLGRQPGWPNGLWSVLAGFVEPGESIEDAVVREVWEEARVSVTGMAYFASQPWPFPASVLLGYHAIAQAGTPQVEQDELEAADWFSREQIIRGVESKSIFLPPPFTLSFGLIQAWFDRGSNKPLVDLI